MIYKSYSEEETYNIAKDLGEQAKVSDVFCLIGDLGVGKTVFTKGFAKGLGIDEHITSPTFTIVNEYALKDNMFYHFDVYRIDDVDEMYDIGFDEYINSDAIVFIEWANLIEDIIPADARWITISKDLTKGTDYRLIEIKER